jgi:hypothetical protein
MQAISRPGVSSPGLFFERSALEFHPIADVFPLMEGEEFKELVKDLAKNGQQQPILTYEGKILDGRNRYRACLEAGIEPWVEGWSGPSPVEAVLSLNLHRRHLSSSQRAAVASRMLPHLEAEAKKRQGVRRTSVNDLTEDRTPQRATAEAARLTGTNRQYVSDAKRLAKEAPEQLERVERGEATIPAARREAFGPAEETSETGEGTPVGDIVGADHPAWTLEWDMPPEGKEYRNVVKWVDRVMKLDPVKVASYCKDDYEANRDLEHVRDMIGWFDRYRDALEKRREDLKPGNLRAVN